MKNGVRDQDLSNMYAHSYCEKEGVFASWLFQLELGNLCIYMHTNMQIYINTYKQKYLACKDAQTNIHTSFQNSRVHTDASNSNSYLQSFSLLFYIPYLYIPSSTYRILVPYNIIFIHLLSPMMHLKYFQNSFTNATTVNKTIKKRSGFSSSSHTPYPYPQYTHLYTSYHADHSRYIVKYCAH